MLNVENKSFPVSNGWIAGWEYRASEEKAIKSDLAFWPARVD